MLTSREQRMLTVGLWLALVLNVGLTIYLIVEGSPVFGANLGAIVCICVALWLRRLARQRDNAR